VTLVWGAGIKADSGIVTTQDQTLSYKTRPDFTARFSCDGCRHARLRAVPADARAVLRAGQTRRRAGGQDHGPGGKVFKPTLDKEEEKASTWNG
jgi:hypothetical protein